MTEAERRKAQITAERGRELQYQDRNENQNAESIRMIIDELAGQSAAMAVRKVGQEDSSKDPHTHKSLIRTVRKVRQMSLLIAKTADNNRSLLLIRTYQLQQIDQVQEDATLRGVPKARNENDLNKTTNRERRWK